MAVSTYVGYIRIWVCIPAVCNTCKLSKVSYKEAFDMNDEILKSYPDSIVPGNDRSPKTLSSRFDKNFSLSENGH